MANMLDGHIAEYLRISDDDADLGGEKKESSSIANQRKVLQDYISRHPEFADHTVKEFLDDGFSGVNFHRPGVQNLLKEVQEKKIACIIVKDDCVIKARTPQPLENRHFLRISAKFRAILRPQRTAHIIGNS